jgi:ATP-dependent Clp protease ATP-binding subunit ClpA
MNTSPVVNLAWQLAAVETAAAKWPFIEPEHFLAALTKLRQFCTGEGARLLEGQGIELSAQRAELELVAEVLGDAAIEPDAFRHELGERLGQGTYLHANGETVHRSERSRKLFERAGALASETKSAKLRSGHLFLAILEERHSPGCRLLQKKGADLATLAQRTRERLVVQPRSKRAGPATKRGPPPGAAVCCECGSPIADAEREARAWIGGMFICARCKAQVEDLANS